MIDMTVKELLSKFVRPDDIDEDLTLDISVYFYHGNERDSKTIKDAIQKYGEFEVKKWSFNHDRHRNSMDIVIIIWIE